MERIVVPGERGRSEILVGTGLLEDPAALLDAAGVTGARAVVSNVTVGPLYARRVASSLGARPPLELPDGEAFKTWAQVTAICRWLLAGGCHRGDAVVAVGGGVVTDTAGFAAAVYMRGVAWVAVPTTLLGMVDAAVGGKTGINLDEGKNLIGAFWAPRLVIADVDTLVSLPGRELRAGLAEVVKAAWIGDREILRLLAAGAPAADHAARWVELVARAVRVKAEIVAADERERGLRRALNFGHTLAHALETATGYRRFLHGEAVAWGCRVAAELARGRGMLGDDSWRALHRALAVVEPLPPAGDLAFGTLAEIMARDKKRDADGVAWVLPTDDGVALDQRVPADEVAAALAAVARG